MAIDQRQGNKVVKSQRREEAPGTRVDPYPYIGIVKNNLDPTRCGRLQVWIADLGGNQDDSKNWRTVSYASPFMGVTNISQKDAGRAQNTANKFTNTPNTYGFWAVPPDIGVEVLVMFIAGDPMRGYWFACVNSSVSRFMIPGIAGSTHTDLSGASADVKNAYRPGNPAPVTEFNDNDPTTYQKADFYNNPKPIHEPQYRVMINQGLDRDTVRGPISSSSQRETPSQVFGISTPGRPFPDAGVRDPENFLAKVAKGQLTEADYAYTTRQGGHSFIMDDGNITGRDQLIRLRTAQGHQIMMHDTENTLYINHADGTSWIEMTNTGAINVYSTNGVNVRSGGSINLHADSDINMNAGGKINIKAGGKFQVDAATVAVLSDSTLTVGAGGAIGLKVGGQFNVDSGPISLKAGGEIAMEGSIIKQNSGGTKAVTPPKPIQVNSFADTVKEPTTGLWVPAGGLSSIVKVAPTHEPYNRGQQPAFTEPTALGIGPTKTYKDSVDKTKTTAGTAPQGAAEADLRAQPKSINTVGPLSTNQMTAFYAQTAKTASGGALGFDKTKFASEYEVVNDANAVGKYQFSYQALKDLGYLTSDCSSNAEMSNSNKWKGKNGIDSLDAFLKTSAGKAEQETAMGEHTLRNYTAMCNSGAITKEMKPEEVAGMLSAAHQLGATGANAWRKGQGGTEVDGDKYFQNGKYAVSVLAPKVETIDQPKTT